MAAPLIEEVQVATSAENGLPESFVRAVRFRTSQGAVVVGDQNAFRNFEVTEENRFSLNYRRKEFIVRISGRQNNVLNGIQFVTNRGRTSQWFGGSGGYPFPNEMRRPIGQGQMITSLERRGFGAFLIQGPVGAQAPTPKDPSLRKLMLNRQTLLDSMFGINLKSIITYLFRGEKKLVKAPYKDKKILWLVMKGDPSILKMLLLGEEISDRDRPTISLFNSLTDPNKYRIYPGKSLLQMILKGDRATPAIAHLAVQGAPNSIAHLLCDKQPGIPAGEKPIARWLLKQDEVNGFNSLLGLLLEFDPAVGDGHPWGSRCMLETLIHGEQTNYKISIVRMLMTGTGSILSRVLEGETEPNGPKRSILRTVLVGESEGNLSITRKLVTGFQDERGNRPALLRYLLKGEIQADTSVLRTLLRGEMDQNVDSLLDLITYRHTYNARRGARDRVPPSEIASALDERMDNGQMRKKSLLQLLLIQDRNRHSDSIVDILVEGELEGRDSLLRVLVGSRVIWENGWFRWFSFEDYLEANDDRTGFTLLDLALGGEEAGGPGTSLLRLLLLGEKPINGVDGSGGWSILRLLLINEGIEGECSILRVLIAGLLAFRKLYFNEERISPWRYNQNSTAVNAAFEEVGVPMESMRQSAANFIFQGFSSAFMGFMDPAALGSLWLDLFTACRDFIGRGAQMFGAVWRRQFQLVADEIRASGTRTNGDWRQLAPQIALMAEDIGNERWIQFNIKLLKALPALGRLINNYRRNIVIPPRNARAAPAAAQGNAARPAAAPRNAAPAAPRNAARPAAAQGNAARPAAVQGNTQQRARHGGHDRW